MFCRGSQIIELKPTIAMAIVRYLNSKVATFVVISLMFSCSESIRIKLPIDSPIELKPAWERVLIEGIGFIDIPPSMENQAGNCKDFVDDIKDINNTGIYRMSESHLWKDDLQNALKSFRITNIR
jgi:hypothetical protein